MSLTPFLEIEGLGQVWKDLFVSVRDCNKCPIAGTTKQKVFGEGPINADIVSVSEASGKDEELAGRPYMGRAGKLWEEMLASVGWHRDNLYVCNAVKCRPTENKLAKDLHEIDNCNHYLIQQINQVSPRLILAFGKTAAYALKVISRERYDKVRMSEWVGEIFQHSAAGAPVLVTYHPSYLLRTPSKCFDTYRHLALAKEFYKRNS